MHKIRTYNKISSKGLSRFEAGKYTVADNVSDPDAFILRSQKLHDEEIPPSVKAVARAGAGDGAGDGAVAAAGSWSWNWSWSWS